MSKAWILVGMMGAGKSSIGRTLAEATNREFIDTDLLIQNRFGRTVSQVFQIYGEETFRAHETSVLAGLEPGEFVIATGGGIVTRPENWVELRRLGLTCYLDASFDTLCERLEVSKKKRPLLETDNWQQRLEDLIAVRKPLYAMADFSVEVNHNDLGLTAESVQRAFEERTNENAS
jgi:shikimate kinase